jgi:hypothetical protein
MQPRAAVSSISRTQAPQRRAADQRQTSRRQPLAPARAALQPERQKQQQPQQQEERLQVPASPPAPTANRSDGIEVELFETMGQDRPQHSANGAAAAEQGDGPWATMLSSIDFSEPASFDGEEKTEYDPLRDGPLRYLGKTLSACSAAACFLPSWCGACWCWGFQVPLPAFC